MHMKPGPRTKRWTLRLLIVSGLIGLFLWGLPVALREGAEWWLQEQGVTAEIEDIDLNLFTGILQLTGADGANAEGDGFHIGHAAVEIELRDLFKQRVHLNRIEMRDARLDLRQDQEQLISLLGLDPNAFASDNQEPSEPTAWQFGLDRLELAAVVLDWQAPDFDEQIALDTGGALDFISWTPEQPVPVDLKLQLAGGELAVRGELRPFEDRFGAQLEMAAQQLNLGVFAPFMKLAGVQEFRGILNHNLNVQAQLGGNDNEAVISGSLSLEDSRVGLGDGGDYAASLNWEGKVIVSQGSDQTAVELDGRLGAKSIAMTLADLQIRNPELGWQGTVRIDQATAMTVTAKGALQAAALELQQGEALSVTRFAPDADIDITYTQAETNALQFDTRIHTAGWAVRQGPQAYQGGDLALTAKGRLDLANPPRLQGNFDLKGAALDLQIDKDSAIRAASLNTTTDLNLLLQAPWTTCSNGKLQITDTEIGFAGGAVTQGKLDWEGTAVYADSADVALDGRLTLSDHLTRLLSSADGTSSDQETGRAVLDGLAWQGKVSVALPGDQSPDTSIDGNGGLTLAGAGYQQTVGTPLQVDAGDLGYDGNWSVQLTPASEHNEGTQNGQDSTATTTTTTLALPGALSAGGLAWSLPDAGQQGSLESASWKGEISATLGATTAYAAQGELVGKALGVKIDAQAMDIRQQDIFWNGNVIQVATATPGVPTVNGDLRSRSLQVTDSRLGRTLLGIEDLTLSRLAVSGEQQMLADSLLVTGINVMQRGERLNKSGKPIKLATPDILLVNSLEVTRPELTNLQRLNIAAIEADGVDAWLLRRSDGSFEFDDWFAGESTSEGNGEDSSTSADAAAAPAGSETAPAFSYAIGAIDVDGDSRLRFRDLSVQPRFAENLTEVSIQIGALDSAAPDQPTEINLVSTIGQRGKLTLAGPAMPLQPRPSFNLKGRMVAVDLASLSPYTAQAIGHGIRQGTVNADLKLVSSKGALDSSAELKLSKVKLERATNAEGLESGLGMPLNQALGLLRDRNDNITLKLPITGDIENPDFSPRDVMRQAIMKAIQFAVINFYSPLGVVFAADKLIDLATAVRFDPIEFEPAMTELPDGERTYLAKLSKLMTDRPAMEIVICGYAIPADRDARLVQIEEGKSLFAKIGDLGDDRTPEEIVTNEDLLTMADERVSSVADYLIEAGIERGRLVSCASKLDSKPEAKGRVEFSF